MQSTAKAQFVRSIGSPNNSIRARLIIRFLFHPCLISAQGREGAPAMMFIMGIIRRAPGLRRINTRQALVTSLNLGGKIWIGR